jgi:MoxR-like ATPase
METKKAKELCGEIVRAVGGVFVGDELLLRKMLCAALANGHVLFEDYPGLGKTLLVKVFGKVTGCSWRRIQFTPDLMPSDIVGTRVWRPGGSFAVEKGPVFTNVLLADEINRATPKTQSALLEAMEEKQVTIEGTTYRLDLPFFVMATQNPIEMEGTYPLPEAQLDRFLLRLSMGYVPTVEAECEILRRRIEWRRDDPTDSVKSVVTKETFKKLQAAAEGIYVHKNILTYISEMVRRTREHPKVRVGSSPRGGLALLKLSKAMALTYGRDFATPDDVKTFARDALAHRLILDVEQAIEGLNPTEIVDEVVKGVRAPKEFSPR